VKHRTKVREYQVNRLAQKVEDKEMRGGREATKATPPPTGDALTEIGAWVCTTFSLFAPKNIS
jgi:hypothetical protein